MSDPTWNDQDDRTRSMRTDDVRVTPTQDATTDDARLSDRDIAQHARSDDRVVVAGDRDRDVLRDRDERIRLGGIRWGAVFFGWLCATGVAVLLIAILAGTGTAIGLTESTVDDVVDGAVGNAGAVSLAGAIALVVVLAISYLAGGYVAARMARFSGRSQGFAVWVLGLVVTLLAALAGYVLGSAYDVFARLDLPRIPVDEGTATTGGVITLVAVLVMTLLAAILGGALGDRYHRRLDEIDLR
jgi:hypothetical protein